MKIVQIVFISLFFGIAQGTVVAQAVEVKLTASDAAEDDYFGGSVSISGDYVIAGASGDDDAGSSSGSAYIFVREGMNWNQRAKLTASDAAAGDGFGGSVSISEDYAIVGASGDDDAGSSSGSVYIFVRSGEIWAEQAKLTASDAAAGDGFGSSVSISGNYAIVGVHQDDHLGGTDAGSAYIFVRNGTNWAQQAKLTASDATTDGHFGHAVSISGDYAIVGAFFWEIDSINSGYIFCRNQGGSDNWGQQAKLSAPGFGWDRYFGYSVSISGDYAIVGNYGWCSLCIFYRNQGGSDNWGQQAELTPADGDVYDIFGWSVSISGDYVIVGAVGNGDPEKPPKAAHSFLRNGLSWSQKGKVAPSDAVASDNFGYSVSISGDYSIVGAEGDDHAGGTDAGSAYIYHSIQDLVLCQSVNIGYKRLSLILASSFVKRQSTLAFAWFL